MERVVLGSVDLSERYNVAVISRPLPMVAYEYNTMMGLDGYRAAGGDRLPKPIQIAIIVKGGPRKRREAVRELSPLLLSKEPQRLSFGSDDGRYYMVVPGGESELQEFVTSGRLDVSFQPLHAAMYGLEKSVTVPSGGSVTFRVGGTYPTAPIITANAVRKSSSQVWGLRLDGGDFLHVATGSNSARAVAIDCGERTCTVAGAVNLPTLDSDWLVLEPGEHTINMDNGTGAATVEWIERWL